MNWDDLRFFLAAVRAGSFSGASALLGVNRTTVARRISQLEQGIGRPLFAHGGSGYQLTEAGQQLFARARDLEVIVEELALQLGKAEEQLSGHLKIAAPLGLGPEFMAELAEFSRTFPQIRWELINSLDPLVSLNQRKADIALAVSDHCPAHLHGEHLGPLERAIYASRDYLLEVPAETSLAQHRWIAWGRDLAQSRAAQWMNANLPRDIARPAEVNSWHALKQAVLAGLGVAPLWCFLADAHPELVAIRPPEPALRMGLWLVSPGGIPAGARARAFRESVAPSLRARVRGTQGSRKDTKGGKNAG